ncbi:MAG: NAD-binding protein [Nitrospinaceae bacterium]|nr:NAD-binding protein [Nitrospinaceae bacterium]
MQQNTGKVAVIGLGSMGLGIAKTLVRNGWDVAGCDLSASVREHLIEAGGAAYDVPDAAANGRSVVLSVVVNARQTETILFGENGVADGMAPGSVFVSCATMLPDAVRALAARLEERGVHYLDAPISGGAKKAASGDLSVMASGTAEAFECAGPVLAVIADKVHSLGDRPGAGASVKMINQLLAGVHIAAACEAMALAAKMELDLEAVYKVIRGSAGNSWMFENRVPHILEGDYTPLSAVEIFVKDLGIVQDIARTNHFPAPLSAAALQMYLAAAGAGMGKDDDASLARVYAQLSGAQLPGDDT